MKKKGRSGGVTGNYRQVSIMPVWGNILESIVEDTITKPVED